jgi:hypothetical protein
MGLKILSSAVNLRYNFTNNSVNSAFEKSLSLKASVLIRLRGFQSIMEEIVLKAARKVSAKICGISGKLFFYLSPLIQNK